MSGPLRIQEQKSQESWTWRTHDILSRYLLTSTMIDDPWLAITDLASRRVSSLT